MFLLKEKRQGYAYIMQRGCACLLFFLWGCLLVFPPAEGAFFAAFGILSAAAGVADLETRQIPPPLCLSIGILGILKLCLLDRQPVLHLLGAVIVSVFFFLIGRLFPAGFGGGDVKLIASSSLFLEWMPLLQGVFTGCLLAACAGVMQWLLRRKIWNCELAFAPFLTVGFLFAVLYGC